MIQFPYFMIQTQIWRNCHTFWTVKKRCLVDIFDYTRWLSLNENFTFNEVNIEVVVNFHLMQWFYYVAHEESSTRTKLYNSELFSYCIFVINHSNLMQEVGHPNCDHFTKQWWDLRWCCKISSFRKDILLSIITKLWISQCELPIFFKFHFSKLWNLFQY